MGKKRAERFDIKRDGREKKFDFAGLVSITHPDKVHEFIHRWPGLYDCARANPEVLALYVPQITIPGFDSDFEDVFDQLLEPNSKQADMIFSYGRHDTIDGKEPLCGDIISLRHPTFGNYTAAELGNWYFYAHDTSYMRSHYDIFEGLVWLLSDDADWLPIKYRQTFIQGISMRDRWVSDVNKFGNSFIDELMNKKRVQFKFSKSVQKGFQELVEEAKRNLGIMQGSKEIMQRFVEADMIKGYYDYREWLDKKRKE